MHVLPLGRTLVHRMQVTPLQFVRFPQQFASTQLPLWMERGTVRVKSLSKNTTQCPQPGLESAPLAPESSALTMRPLCLPTQQYVFL